MKFAKELEDTAIPEWRGSYFDYKTGKKRLKALAKALKNAPRRETHHPDLPLVRKNNNVTPATSAHPVSGLVDELSPLQPKQEQQGERPEKQRMASYGSIIGSPSNSPATRPKSNITLVPTLELPGPAARTSEDIDRSRSASLKLPAWPSPSVHPFGRAASSQLAHTGNAYEIRSPKDRPVEGGEAPPRGSLRFRNLLPNRTNSMPLPHGLSATESSSPKKHRDDNDVALETYKEADFREAEFFLFLDRELGKIEKFYKAKEDEAQDQLVAIRKQLHIMRDIHKAEREAYGQRHRAGDAESQLSSREPADRRSKESQSILNQYMTRPFVRSLDLASEAFDRLRPGNAGKPPTPQAMENLATPDDSNWNPNPDQRDYHRKALHDVPYRDAKRKMKRALAEHYRFLELLKSYAEANRKAFRKINKKYDKTVNAKPPQRYMNEQVAKSYFNTSDEVDLIMWQDEDIYARYFEKGNRKVAISKLRAKKRNEDAHSGAIVRASALLGAGSVLSLLGVIEGANLLNSRDSTKATQTSFLLQLYGGYFLMFLLAMFFALCTRVYTANKVNFQFVFELNRRHALGWRKILEIPSWFLFLLGLVMYLNFNVQAGGETFYRYWPVVLIGVAVVILFFPAPILYHRARRWFLYSMARLIAAPFLEVEYRDFFLGDMFCSLTYAMSGIEIFFCLYVNDWDQPARCTSSHSRILGFLTTLPAIWRALQCLRRYYPTRNIFPHLANFAKYACTILVYVTLSLYRINRTTETKGLFMGIAIINSVFTSLWDILMDWSLGDFEAKHRGLRKTLAYRDHIWWYYAAIPVDVILRFNWIFYIIVPLGSQHSTITSFLIALSEVFRRGIWTVFRVENEHCSNIRNEKASKKLRLPYKLLDNYDEEQGVGNAHSDASSEDHTSDTANMDDKQVPMRDDGIPRSDLDNSLDNKSPSKKSPMPLRSTTEASQSPRLDRNGKSTRSTGNSASNASGQGALGAENAGNLGLHRQSTTESANSLRRRQLQGSNSGSGGTANSPIVSALHRVGNTLRTAHEQDFARKNPETDGADDSLDDEDDEDDSDDE